MVSLKVLDPERPIREADMFESSGYVSFVPESDIFTNALNTRSGGGPF
jgi:hypothetical protein